MTETTTETTEAQSAQNADRATAAEQSGDSDAKNAGLAGLKLAQLQALASQLGITGGSRMRKAALVEAISSHQRGGAVAEREAKTAKSTEGDSQKDGGQPTRNGRSKKDQSGGGKPGAEKSAPKESGPEKSGPAQAETQKINDDAAAESSGARTSDRAQGGDQQDGRQAGQQKDGQQQKGQNRHRRNRDRGGDHDAHQQGGGQQKDQQDRKPGQQEQKQRDQQSGRQGGQQGDKQGGGQQKGQQGDKQGGGQQKGQQQKGQHGGDNRQDNRGGDNRNDDGGRRNRRNRNRNDRNNRRRGRGGPEVDETEVTEDDVLIPVAGILDVLDNYAFVRTSGYLSGQNDVYVSLAQVKRHNLRKGDAVTGHIRAPREDDQPNKRKKFNALVKLESVNGRPSEANQQRTKFSDLVPLYPQERLRLEGDPKNVSPRVIDLVSPIGKGQRGLIVSPPKAGKTMILQSLANAIKTNNPEVHLMMVLVDERPEEVTDMQRTVDGEVIASTFDRPADDHTTVAELAIERAKRLVELGKDVVVLLDSMTRLGRAYNTAAPASGRILSGGVDANALYPPKRFFGAARNIENGGSLTILATALVETGSKMDEVIFEEFKGTGNMELRLSRRLADKRIFPAVNVNESSTRREEALLSPEEIKIMWKLRRVLSGLEQEQGLDLLLKKIKETQSNAEFLMLANKTTLGETGK